MLPLDHELPRAAAEELFRRWEEGTVRPMVGEPYALEDGARCLTDLAERRVAGKPVLRVR